MYSGTSAGAAAVGVAMLELMAELEAEAREGTPRSAPVSGAVSPAAAGFSPRGDGRIRSRGFNIYKRPNPASAQVPGAPAPCHSHVLALYPH